MDSKSRLILALLMSSAALAHESRPGYLELRETGPGQYAVLWKQPVLGEMRLPIDPVFPSQCKVRSAGEGVVATGSLVLRGTLECPDGLGGKTIGVSGLEGTVTDVLVRILRQRCRHRALAQRGHAMAVGIDGVTNAGDLVD